MLDLYSELKGLVAGFNWQGVQYALCGGLAMSVHGLPRATIDIDVLILSEAVDQVRDLVAGLGYTLEALPMEFAEGAILIRRFSKIDTVAGDVLPLDFLLVTPRIQSVWDSRVEIEWEGQKLSVVSREGLISLKSLRGSGVDLHDIRLLKERADEG